jgi:hypothetical protein
MAKTEVQIRGDRPPQANTSRGTHSVVVGLVLSHDCKKEKVLDAPCGEGALT